MTEGGYHNQPCGTWSDDSSMTLATLDSFIECDAIDHKDIMNRFMLWSKSEAYGPRDECFDIGFATCRAFVVKALETICPDAIPDYIRMIFMDTVCANPDRHTNNFGLLRDIKTGELLGFAPNYDNNMALISRGYPSKPGARDVLISLFNELMEEYPDFKAYVPEITEVTVREVLDKLNMKVKSQVIVDLVVGRYCLIK